MFEPKYSTEKPPCFDVLQKYMPGPEWEKCDDVVTFGGTIYCRHIPLAPDVEAHEMIHIRQQAQHPGGPLGYLNEYCQDPKFRKAQELEAYRGQMRFLKAHGLDRNALSWAREKLARDFSTMYNLGITHAEAIKLLTL